VKVAIGLREAYLQIPDRWSSDSLTVMRIVHVITNLSRAGAEMMLYKLLSGMDRQDFESVVVSLTEYGPLAERITQLGIPVFAVGMGSGLSLPVAVWRLIRIVRRFEPDLLQGWQYHGNLATLVASLGLMRQVPVVWNIRHTIYALTDEKRATRAVIKLCARLSHKPAHVIYVARASAAQHEALGYQAKKSVVIPNGFDTNQFTPSVQARMQLRAELGLSPNALLIGLIARYHPVKDHASFLRAAALLLQTHPEAHFLLAGEDVDRRNRALMELIASLTLSENVHLLGRRDDMPRVIAALDVGTSASSGEGFSNAIGEAMACGVPCVVTDVGDSALVVGETGRVVPPKNPLALSEGWRALVEMSSEERTQLGLRARHRIQDYYSLVAIVARYEQLYREIGGKGSVVAISRAREMADSAAEAWTVKDRQRVHGESLASGNDATGRS